MAIKFDKILGKLREKDTTVAADAIEGIVDYYADLPAANAHTGKFWLVRYASGIYIISRKPAGLYYSNGSTWANAPDIIPFFDDDNFRIYDNVDNTKVMQFDASAITAGQTRVITAPNANINLGTMATDIAAAKLALIEHAGTGLNNSEDIDMLVATNPANPFVYTFTVEAGSGYISNNTDERVRLEWDQQTLVAPVGIGANFVRIADGGNGVGVLSLTMDGTYSVDEFIELGYVFTGYAGAPYLLAIINLPKSNSRFTSRVNDFMTLGLRAIVETGTGVSAGVTAFTLNIAEGSFFAILKRKELDARTYFTKVFNSTDAGWTPLLTDPNVLDPNTWNDITKTYGSSLITLTTGYWKQDVVFRIPNGDVYVVCGQAEYATKELALAAPLATVPGQLSNVAIFLAKITMQQGSAAIDASNVYDIRPYFPRVFGFGSASAGAVQSHSALSGLGADDHTQYYNESRGDARYAPIAEGVTNGDSHDHTGGDGAQISYSGLSNLPTLGTAAAKNIPAAGNASATEVVYGSDTRLTDARTPATHDNTKHSATYIVQADAVIPNAAITGATKTKITYDAKGLVTSGADATTADIADSTNKRYCTDAEKTVIGNTSNTNTGDETESTIKTKLGITTLSGSNTGDQTLSGLGGVPTSRTVNSKALSSDISITATDVGLGNVTNESKATMFTNPAFTGTPTGIAEAVIAFTDILTNNVSSTKHGYCPKLPNNTTTFLRGDGAYAAPTAVPTPGGSDTQVQYNNGGVMAGTSGATVVSNILTIPAEMDFVSASIPTAPAAGKITAFSRSLAGRPTLSVIGDTGADYPLQSALYDKNVTAWFPGTSTTASIAMGCSWTVGATQAHPALATTNLLTSMRRATFTTSTTSGNASGIRTSAAVCWRGNAAGLGGFFFKCRFGFVTVQSAMQFWVGLTAQTTILAGEPNAVANSFVLGKLTGGTNMALFSRDATTLSTLLTTTVAPAANDIYDLTFFAPPNGSTITVRLVNIRTNTVVIDNVSYNTNLPANTAFLLPVCDIRTNAASAVSIAVNRIFVESDI